MHSVFIPIKLKGVFIYRLEIISIRLTISSISFLSSLIIVSASEISNPIVLISEPRTFILFLCLLPSWGSIRWKTNDLWVSIGFDLKNKFISHEPIQNLIPHLIIIDKRQKFKIRNLNNYSKLMENKNFKLLVIN